jgi:hypothetical protein
VKGRQVKYLYIRLTSDIRLLSGAESQQWVIISFKILPVREIFFAQLVKLYAAGYVVVSLILTSSCQTLVQQES